MDWLTKLDSPQNALAILTAMITPAVLISACGALIFSTSSRLGRVVDRTRTLSDRFQQLAAHPEQDDMSEERRVLIFTQLDRQTSRARLIQRAMAAYYIALGIFVASTVSIAIFSAAAKTFTWIAVLLGVIGTLYMLYGSVLLIIESRMALAAIMTEMDFVWKVSQKYAGKELVAKPGGPFTWLGKKF
jgi:threonine/homoserine/homoserine lactone efflux protein